MACRLIDRCPENGDDPVTLTDNDAGGSISMTMIFELHAVAVDDEYNFSRYVSVLKIFIYQQHSTPVCIIFSFLVPMILSLVRIILLTPIFCTTTSITTVSLSIF